MLSGEEILKIKELADAIKESGLVEYNNEPEELVGSCVTDEAFGFEEVEEGVEEGVEENAENAKAENAKAEDTKKETMILYSLAVKRYVVEKHSALDESDVQQYVKKYGGKQKTRLRAAMNSARFKEIYESCYAKNIQDAGIDAIFSIPMLKEEKQMNLLQFLNLLYDSFVKSHLIFKNQMIKISRTYYKEEKNKRIQTQKSNIIEFLEYYVDNPTIFTDENLVQTLNDAGAKYGPNFMSDIHPVLYIFSELLGYKMEGLFFKQLDVLEDWLSIKYDDKDTSGKIEKLFIKMFYSKTPIKKNKVEEMANQYWAVLSELMEAEKKNKENVRIELAEESTQIKKARIKDDMKLKLHKSLRSK